MAVLGYLMRNNHLWAMHTLWNWESYINKNLVIFSIKCTQRRHRSAIQICLQSVTLRPKIYTKNISKFDIITVIEARTFFLLDESDNKMKIGFYKIWIENIYKKSISQSTTLQHQSRKPKSKKWTFQVIAICWKSYWWEPTGWNRSIGCLRCLNKD